MAIRIIGGSHRGRRLQVIDNPGLRPTTDRMRETMFNILGSRVELEGARVLDLFAGSGALGIEALSRGAASVIFLEKSGAAARQIAGNLADLDLAERGRVIRGDLFSRLRSLDRFDLVLADPPYRTDLTGRLLEVVPEHLEPGGYFFLERPHPSVDYRADNLDEVLDRTVGATRLTLYQRSDESGGDR